jgi:hypothetical protein
MAERTAAEVLAEKLNAASVELQISADPALYRKLAARLAEDPAITVRTDMVVERFVVERHRPRHSSGRTVEQIHRYLTSEEYLFEICDHRVIVRPYPEDPDA